MVFSIPMSPAQTVLDRTVQKCGSAGGRNIPDLSTLGQHSRSGRKVCVQRNVQFRSAAGVRFCLLLLAGGWSFGVILEYRSCRRSPVEMPKVRIGKAFIVFASYLQVDTSSGLASS